jgi:hypothetical protein
MSLAVKKRQDNTIYVAPTDVDDWLKKEFDDSDGFNDSLTVRTAFRTIGSKKTEHIINRMAAIGTAHHDDIFPGGRMCHVEVIACVRADKYVKISVIKKSYNGQDEKGNIIWKKGCVHCKFTTPSEWKSKYVFLKLHAQRSEIKKMLQFCLKQNGAPFNHAAYYACMILPSGLGPKFWTPALNLKPVSMFCSQFIVLSLQALAAASDKKYDDEHWRERIKELNAATSSPNSVYRLLVKSTGVFGDSALGRAIEV